MVSRAEQLQQDIASLDTEIADSRARLLEMERAAAQDLQTSGRGVESMEDAARSLLVMLHGYKDLCPEFASSEQMAMTFGHF